MTTHDKQGNPPKIERRRGGFWSKIGGGALTIAVIFHGILLIIGASWVFQITREPEKKVDFMPSGGGGGERSADKVAVKKLKQITPTTNSKRVFAEGAKASYAIPEQGDNFGEMSALSSLSGGGMSGGLGGSGSGSGSGSGKGAGGVGGLAGGGLGIKFFGLQTNAKRIAFLLDYSGSMSGNFRKLMERELDGALRKLTPEVIIFMTDGQIPTETARRTLSAIDASLEKGMHVPVLNCLWIKNPTYKSDHLKSLPRNTKANSVKFRQNPHPRISAPVSAPVRNNRHLRLTDGRVGIAHGETIEIRGGWCSLPIDGAWRWREECIRKPIIMDRSQRSIVKGVINENT